MNTTTITASDITTALTAIMESEDGQGWAPNFEDGLLARLFSLKLVEFVSQDSSSAPSEFLELTALGVKWAVSKGQKASKPIGKFLSITVDGKVHMSGVSLPSKTRVLAQNSEAITLHVPGHKYWAGQGLQGYAPAEVQVFRVLEETQGGPRSFTFTVEPLISYPARS